MAKTVKFNMKFGETYIRSVEDLQDNFIMDDVLEHFENGLLLKFLRRKGFDRYADKVAMLTDKNLDMGETAIELTEIFGITAGKEALSEYAESIKIRREKQQAYEAYAKGMAKEQTVIQKYVADYLTIVNQLVDYKDDLGKIEALVWDLIDTYMSVLLFDWRALFFNLVNNAALYPICHMLTYDFFRERWLTKDDHEIVPGDRQVMANRLFQDVKAALKTPKDFPWIKKYSSDADYWEDVEDTGKSYIVLFAPRGSMVRAFGDTSSEYDADEINDIFISLDGIQYRHDDDEELFYAEV